MAQAVRLRNLKALLSTRHVRFFKEGYKRLVIVLTFEEQAVEIGIRRNGKPGQGDASYRIVKAFDFAHHSYHAILKGFRKLCLTGKQQPTDKSPDNIHYLNCGRAYGIGTMYSVSRRYLCS